MKRILALAVSLSACTYATISATPVQLADGSTAFRYSGRDNFPHQRVEADREMSGWCSQIGGGRPIVVQQGSSIIGGGLVINNGIGTAMANRQQDIIFKCIK